MISDRHRLLYNDYYASRTIVPRASVWLPRVEELAENLKARTILDYGSGAARGISRFSWRQVEDYDPGIPGLDYPPLPADLVVSIHTLEHVEAQYIDWVIAHIISLACKAAFIVVSCESSTKVLPDGSPWHSFVRDAEWWHNKLAEFSFASQPILKDPAKEFAALRGCTTLIGAKLK